MWEYKDEQTLLVVDLLNRTNVFSCYDSRKIKNQMEAKTFSSAHYTVTIKYAYLDMNDYLLYVYILKKWLLANERTKIYSNKIEIPFHEISELYGISKSYLKKDKKKACKRFHDSIDRLTDVKINLHDKNKKETEFNHLLGDGSKLQEGREMLIAVIPDFIKTEFQTCQFSFINIDWFRAVKTQRAKALMRFISTHSLTFNTHSLAFYRQLLNLTGNDERADDAIRKAYKELVALDFLKDFKINKFNKNGKKRTVAEYTYTATQAHKISYFSKEMKHKYSKRESKFIFKEGKYTFIKPEYKLGGYGNSLFPIDDSDIPF